MSEQNSSWSELIQRRHEIAAKRIVAGYDGFIDTAVRPLSQSSADQGTAKRFETIREFGEFLISKAEKSCSIELEVESRHAGGNLPFLAQGAGALGLSVTGIGMLGDGGVVEKVFREISGKYYTYAPPGESTCLEFNDGKVMMAPTVRLAGSPWERVQEATGGRAGELFHKADLTALVNWSELTFAQELWTDTYVHAFASEACDKECYVFFDLCDISRKTVSEIRKVLELMGRFSGRRTTILSLNENEALVIGEKVLDGQRDLREIAELIAVNYEIDEILIHTIRRSMLWCRKGYFEVGTEFVEKPVCSTGAGDHFNAASCFAVVMGLNPEKRLVFANRAASLYVGTGRSPGVAEILVGLCVGNY